MLSPSLSEDYKDFKSEAEFLLRVHHQNLTSLLGYCDEGDKLGLIYEFMSNGDLHSRISDMNSKHLTWEERLHISLDAAQGLEHLHNGYKPPPLHKNIKSSNILLSENFVAKLAGFGLSRVSVDGQHDVVTAIMASPSGYLDPKYYYTERLDAMSDVFSLGIVLLEVITSKPVMVPTTDYRIHIRKWVGEQMTSAGGYDVKAILDSRLGEEYEKISAWKFVQVALACSSLTANERPTMSWVVNELRQCLSLEIARKREGLATDTMCEEAPFCSTLSSNQLVLS